MYPGRHGLRVQHLLCYVILYPSFPVRDRAPGATNWEHDGVSAHVSGSARVEFPLDVFGQTRYAVWVLLRAWEAETERQLGRRICRQDSGNGRVRNLERFKTDVTRRIGVGLGILWNGGNRSGECWGGTEGNLRGRGSSCSLDLPLPFDAISSISGFLERAGMGKNGLEIAGVWGDAAAAATFPLPLSFMSCA